MGIIHLSKQKIDIKHFGVFVVHTNHVSVRQRKFQNRQHYALQGVLQQSFVDLRHCYNTRIWAVLFTGFLRPTVSNECALLNVGIDFWWSIFFFPSSYAKWSSDIRVLCVRRHMCVAVNNSFDNVSNRWYVLTFGHETLDV